jgi:transposase
MMRPIEFTKIYLYRPSIDFRLSISGLTAFIVGQMQLNPMDKILVAFTNKRRDRIKMIYWDRTGFCMWYKILNEEKFKWPRKISDEILCLTQEQLYWLLDGYDYVKLRPHKTLEYKLAA